MPQVGKESTTQEGNLPRIGREEIEEREMCPRVDDEYEGIQAR
jgi:hypothetical protein